MKDIDFKAIQALSYCKTYTVSNFDNFAKNLATVKFINDSTREDSSARFIYITPSYSTAQYIGENCKSRDGTRFKRLQKPSTDEIITLIEHRTSIISGTDFLKSLTPKCMNLIYKYDYTLILDDAPIFFEPCQITKDDANILLNRYVYTKKNGSIHWRKDSADYSGVFTEYKNYCDLNCLRTYDKELFIWCVPSTVFKVFKQVCVLANTPEARAHSLYYKCAGITPITMSVTGTYPCYAFTEANPAL